MDKNVVLDETLPLLVLIDAATIVERALEKRLLGPDLGVTHLRILVCVSQAEGKLTPSLLGGLLVQAPYSISGLLKRLEDKALVIRTRDKYDRRKVWISLTKKGRELVRSARQILSEFSQEFALHFANKKGADAVQLLAAFRDRCYESAGLDGRARVNALQIIE